jgi:hypothetical protein
MDRSASTTRGQTSLEGLIIAVIVVLLAAIGIGYLATFQAPTTALVLAKEDVLRQLQRLEVFHQVANVDYSVSGTTLHVSVNVDPDLSAPEQLVLAGDKTALENRIMQKTNYSPVTISWQ